MELNFKKWLEYAGNPSGVDFPDRAFEIPRMLQKMYGGAYQTVEEPLPGNKKMKKMKKMKKKQKKN